MTEDTKRIAAWTIFAGLIGICLGLCLKFGTAPKPAPIIHEKDPLAIHYRDHTFFCHGEKFTVDSHKVALGPYSLPPFPEYQTLVVGWDGQYDPTEYIVICKNGRIGIDSPE